MLLLILIIAIAIGLLVLGGVLIHFGVDDWQWITATISIAISILLWIIAVIMIGVAINKNVGTQGVIAKKRAEI